MINIHFMDHRWLLNTFNTSYKSPFMHVDIKESAHEWFVDTNINIRWIITRQIFITEYDIINEFLSSTLSYPETHGVINRNECNILLSEEDRLYLVFDKQEDYNLFKLTWR